MNRRIFLLAGAGLTLAACGTASAPPLGADGKPLPRVYKMGSPSEVSFRFLDAMNTLRSARSLRPVAFDASLNAAAETHARDMSVQNRPWHFGSDGSSPLVRAQRSGFNGRLLGENISETYETELETLSSWMAQPDTRVVIMDPLATRLGFAWYQEPGGKIWWVMMTGV
ncbi:CAP domain-containing protein [Rhodobacter calidifons]|uniref:CAP domain-containing protein n=1 Tax=Rhodobacter calidifons TaxID=2715277 RepID=A0ABX0G4Z5_9RHOB|nr:CAP domain-containing protein [Rhodobacter calidifons]NHB75975.1 CAP domain-containing protein [Rhodobacter calidifons]